MNIQRFIDYLKIERRYSTKTLMSYELDLNQFHAYFNENFDGVDWRNIRKLHVRSWIIFLIESKYQESSIHRKISSLNGFFKYFTKLGVITENPSSGVIKPKKQSKLPTFIDERTIIKFYKDEEIGDLENLTLMILYETGIRRSEVIGLRWSDVDFTRGTLKVLGKRNKTRILPLSDVLLARLKKYQVQGENLFVIGNLPMPISISKFYRMVNRLLKRYSTSEKRSPHVLRHSFATHMLNNGADLNAIKEILGHSSLAATQVYTHTSIEKLKQMHKKLHPRNKD